MLTSAVFAVVLTAPLGAIMINTLGEKWLQYDGDDPVLLAKQGLTEPRPRPPTHAIYANHNEKTEEDDEQKPHPHVGVDDS